MKRIVITGATGSFGKATINYLLKNGTATENITALVRDEKKAEDLKDKGITLKFGDYNDYSSLVNAFQGTDILLFISGSDVVNRTRQHENVVKAAKEAKVGHIVYTSFQRKNETDTSPIALVADAHIKTEKWLKESGISYTILKNNLYMDMLPVFISDKVMETGTIYLPAGEGKAAYVLRDDMAEVAAHILSTPGHENKVYDITAETAYSYNDIAKILSAITGKDIRYVSPSQEEFTKTMTKADVPVQYIALFADFSEATRQGEFEYTSNTIEKLIGRKPVSPEDFLKQIYS